MNAFAHTVGHADTPVYRRRTPTLLQVIGRTVWRSLEAVGHRRAARELGLGRTTLYRKMAKHGI